MRTTGARKGRRFRWPRRIKSSELFLTSPSRALGLWEPDCSQPTSPTPVSRFCFRRNPGPTPPLSKDSGRYFFECYVYGPNSKIGDTEDPSKAIWYDEAGNEATPVHGTGPVQLATEDDYYGRILPTIKRLERSIPSAAPTDELTPYRVGLVDCWQWRK